MVTLTSSADIIRKALRKAGEVGNGNSSLQSQALEYLNDSYLSLLAGASEFGLSIGEPWYWARNESPLCLVLKPSYETDTVLLTNGSRDGVFDTPPTESMRGRHLKLDDRAEYSVVQSHASGSANFKLDCEFIGATGNFNFKMVKIVYDLGNNILRLVESFQVYKNQLQNHGEFRIYGRDKNIFDREFPLHTLRRMIPTYFTVIRQTDDEYKIQFNGFVDEDTRVEIEFIELPEALTDSADSFPLVPQQHRNVLEYMVASQLLFNDKKDAQSGSIHFNLAKAKMKAMVEANNRQVNLTGRSRGRLIPRPDKMGLRRFRNRDLLIGS